MCFDNGRASQDFWVELKCTTEEIKHVLPSHTHLITIITAKQEEFLQILSVRGCFYQNRSGIEVKIKISKWDWEGGGGVWLS